MDMYVYSSSLPQVPTESYFGDTPIQRPLKGIRKRTPEADFGLEKTMQCVVSIIDVLRHFEVHHIEFLVKELIAGRVNGSYANTDMLGTLTLLPHTEDRLSAREALYKKIGKEPHADGNYFEIWFQEIHGGQDVSKYMLRSKREIELENIAMFEKIAALAKIPKEQRDLMALKEKTEDQHEPPDFLQITVGICQHYLSSRNKPLIH